MAISTSNYTVYELKIVMNKASSYDKISLQLEDNCHPGPETSNGATMVYLVGTIVIGSGKQPTLQNTHGRITSSVGETTKLILEYVST